METITIYKSKMIGALLIYTIIMILCPAGCFGVYALYNAPHKLSLTVIHTMLLIWGFVCVFACLVFVHPKIQKSMGWEAAFILDAIILLNFLLMSVIYK